MYELHNSQLSSQDYFWDVSLLLIHQKMKAHVQAAQAASFSSRVSRISAARERAIFGPEDYSAMIIDNF
jgi:hypothetical protein